MRFLTGRAVSLSHTFYGDETPITVPSVSVTVWPEGSDTSAFEGAATSGANSSWTVEVPALAQGVYTVRWDADTYVDEDTFEVVGRHMFSILEARGSDDELSDTARFSTDDIKTYREAVEVEFQRVTGRSFTPRTARVPFTADGSDDVFLGVFDCEALSGLVIDGETVDPADYGLDENGLLSGLCGFSEGTQGVATVDYGFRVPPADIKRVGMVRLRYFLAAESTAIPDRATNFVAAEGGQFTLAQPGRNGYKTGIPEVDAVLTEYAYDLLKSVGLR